MSVIYIYLRQTHSDFESKAVEFAGIVGLCPSHGTTLQSTQV